jgi:predicted AAA+ superfamily ATPase
VGVFQSLRPKGPLDSTDEIGGIALETLVAQHLRAWNDYRNDSGKLFYWRTTHGVEVDFVFYGPTEFVAIEVKSKANIFEKDLRGLKIFGEDYPEAKLIMLYQGKHRLKIKNVYCIPIEDFLLNLVPTKGLGEI